jgi:hypothetical protein
MIHTFTFALEYAIRKIQESLVEVKCNGAHELLVYVDADCEVTLTT